MILVSSAKSNKQPVVLIPLPNRISNSAILNGGATLFFATLTLALIPYSSVPRLRV